MYFSTIESGNNNIKFIQNKWLNCLNINFETVVKGFKNAKTISSSVHQHFKQYKLLHRTVHNEIINSCSRWEYPALQF